MYCNTLRTVMHYVLQYITYCNTLRTVIHNVPALLTLSMYMILNLCWISVILHSLIHSSTYKIKLKYVCIVYCVWKVNTYMNALL